MTKIRVIIQIIGQTDSVIKNAKLLFFFFFLLFFYIDLYSHIKIKYKQLQFLNVQLVIASISSSILAILNQILETTITTLIDLN